MLELEKEIEEDKKKLQEEFNDFGEKDIEIRLEAEEPKKPNEPENLSLEGSESDKEDLIHNNAAYKQLVMNDKKSEELR